MKRKWLALWLKVMDVFFALLGLLVLLKLVPDLLYDQARAFPEFAWLTGPIQIGCWVGAVPIALAMGLFWRICTRIGRDESFSQGNARALRGIALCAAIDMAYILVWAVVLSAAGASNGGVMLLALGAMAGCGAVVLAALLLAHLVGKAHGLQVESELTV